MRFFRPALAIAIVAAAATGVAVLQMGSATAALAKPAKAVVHDVNGANLGTVLIQPIGTKLIITGKLSGLTAGFHGFHIHSVGICDPKATDAAGNIVPFGSAGGHLNPAGTTHGHHAGDLPLLYVSADGTASSIFETDATNLATILDADGGALIIHALPDNYANIPPRYSANGVAGPDAATLGTGDSGGRVGCGVITAVK